MRNPSTQSGVALVQLQVARRNPARHLSSRRAAVAAAVVLACAAVVAAPEQSSAHPAGPAMTVLASAPGPIALGSAPVRVRLSSAVEAAALQTALKKAAAKGSAKLRLSGLSARAQPGVVYRVYFGLGEGAVPDEGHAVGSINFFNVVPLPGARPKPDQPIDFSVARQLKALLGSGAAAAGLAVAVVPKGAAQPESQPAIGSIELLGEI